MGKRTDLQIEKNSRHPFGDFVVMHNPSYTDC